MRGIVVFAVFAAMVALLGYGAIGTSGNVEEIKKRFPAEVADRGWEILRYEGFQYGAFGKHGGRVWYHVADVNNSNIQYRVQVTLWGGELQYWYGAPEKLNRVELDLGGEK